MITQRNARWFDDVLLRIAEEAPEPTRSRWRRRIADAPPASTRIVTTATGWVALVNGEPWCMQDDGQIAVYDGGRLVSVTLDQRRPVELDPDRPCAHCGALLRADAQANKRYCSRRCIVRARRARE